MRAPGPISNRRLRKRQASRWHSSYEAAGKWDLAIARYRTILESSPDEVVALNNLAYALAVRKGVLGEALSLAERAYGLAPKSGAVLDTLGWIRYMGGDAKGGLGLLVEAVRMSPDIGELRLHLAQALAATGDSAAARVELAKALELDPTLKSRPEVKALQEQEQGKPK